MKANVFQYHDSHMMLDLMVTADKCVPINEIYVTKQTGTLCEASIGFRGHHVSLFPLSPVSHQSWLTRRVFESMVGVDVMEYLDFMAHEVHADVFNPPPNCNPAEGEVERHEIVYKVRLMLCCGKWERDPSSAFRGLGLDPEQVPPAVSSALPAC